jgi:transposase
VIGIVERGGDVVTRHIQGRMNSDLLPQVSRFVKHGSKVYTDDWSGYLALTERFGFEHEAVNHSAKEYVRGDVHTNTIEGFWANVKRGINGTYVWVSKKHLQTYLREFEYRHNLRHAPYLMFDCLLASFPKVRVE